MLRSLRTELDRAGLSWCTAMCARVSVVCLVAKLAQLSQRALLICLCILLWLQRFAKNYPDVIFIKFYGNSNELTKYLFEERLHTTQTPYFTFFRQGKSTSCIKYVCMVPAKTALVRSQLVLILTEVHFIHYCVHSFMDLDLPSRLKRAALVVFLCRLFDWPSKLTKMCCYLWEAVDGL